MLIDTSQNKRNLEEDFLSNVGLSETDIKSLLTISLVIISRGHNLKHRDFVITLYSQITLLKLYLFLFLIFF